MFSSRGTVRCEERGQGYRDVEKVGKHWSSPSPRHYTDYAVPVVCREVYPLCNIGVSNVTPCLLLVPSFRHTLL